MKKIFLMVLILVVINMNKCCYAYESSPETEQMYEAAEKYDESGIIREIDVFDDDYITESNYILKKTLSVLLKEIKASWKYLAQIIFVCILSSILKSFASKKEICEIGSFACFCVCAAFVLSGFKLISDTCLNTTRNINDFMSLSLPVYASVVAECGYTVTATTMQGIFMLVSVLISNFIVELIYPLLYFCGLLTSVNGISSHINLSRFIKLISKVIKYSVGITMTIFAGIITFSGLSSGAGDNIAIKTIKYTVSNFVPVVGTCLSDALSSVIGSGHILKNNMGYVGFLCLISVCLFPLIKVAISILIFRLSASAAEMFMESNISSMIDSVCDILAAMVSMLLFIMAVFMLIIGIMASTG